MLLSQLKKDEAKLDPTPLKFSKKGVCVCLYVCILFTYTISISIICDSQEEHTLIGSNQ